MLVAHTKSVTGQRDRLRHLALESEAETISRQLDFVVEFIKTAASGNPAILEMAARDIALSLAQVYIGRMMGTLCGGGVALGEGAVALGEGARVAKLTCKGKCSWAKSGSKSKAGFVY